MAVMWWNICLTISVIIYLFPICKFSSMLFFFSVIKTWKYEHQLKIKKSKTWWNCIYRWHHEVVLLQSSVAFDETRNPILFIPYNSQIHLNYMMIQIITWYSPIMLLNINNILELISSYPIKIHSEILAKNQQKKIQNFPGRPITGRWSKENIQTQI